MPETPRFDLLRWDTPFSGARFPPVEVLGDETGTGEGLTVLVSPTDDYPKYLVRFLAVQAFKAEEESRFCPPELVPSFNAEPGVGCTAVRFGGTLWWEWYEERIRLLYDATPAHYYIFGGDYEFEVICAVDPEIEVVTGPRALAVAHSI